MFAWYQVFPGARNAHQPDTVVFLDFKTCIPHLGCIQDAIAYMT
jgi:hypothetical protein